MMEYKLIDDEIAEPSKDVTAMSKYWTMVDDLVLGEEAVKDKRDTYLPKFPDEEVKDYDFRLSCGVFTNVYRDILESLSAKPFEQEVSLITSDNITVPPQLETFIENVDGAGNNLTGFAAEVFFRGINSAVHWIFVDYPVVEGVRTLADEKRANIQPYWSHILASNMLEVQSKMIGGKQMITRFRYMEPGDVNRIRVMDHDTGELPTWAIYEEIRKPNTTTVTWELVDKGTFTIGVIPVVPFMTGRRMGNRWYWQPMMRDAANAQVHLYREETALEYAKVMGAHMMLAGNGVKPELDAAKNPKPISIRPAGVLYAPPNSDGTSGSWSFIGPPADLLNFLSGDIEKRMQMLRELGRQPLTAQTPGLTVVTTAFAAGKARSAVAMCALNLKNALENAFVLTCMWLNINKDQYDPQVFVYTDFDKFTDDKSLTALRDARKDRDISQETYLGELKRRNVLSPDIVVEDEIIRVASELPGDGENEFETIPNPTEQNDVE